MTRELLRTLGSRLDETSAALARLDSYYAGTQPLAFLAPEAVTALGTRLGKVATNIPRLVVTSLSERLDVTGFTRDGKPDLELWRVWEANGMTDQAPTAHREALALGRSFVIVWAGPNGPQISVESARQVAVVRDPVSRSVLGAVKRWDLPNGLGQQAVTYTPDVITRYSTNAAGAPADSGAWKVTETIRNPLGVVPVVPMVNGDRLLDFDGVSEMTDVLDLTDALAKCQADMLVTSEFYARPRRWATGIEVPVDEDGDAVNPFASEADKTWISEAPESKFGQFAAADLGAYEAATRVIMQGIMAVSGLPGHFLGILHDNPSSADAIRSAEASLTARALARQRTFGRAWSDVGRLVYAVRDGIDPAVVSVEPTWRNPESRTPAQTADAVSKLVAAGILPVSEALSQLGYTAEDIDRIRSARRGDALDGAGVNFAGLMP